MNWVERRRRDRRNRRLRRFGIAAAAILLLAGGAGALLPAEYACRAELLLALPPESIWRVLTDLDGMPEWRSDLSALERLPDLSGRPAWREIGQGGATVLEQAAADPPRRLVVRRTLDGRPGFPVRIFDLSEDRSGTRLTVTERYRVRNPMGRLLARFGLTHPPVTRLLRDLDAHVGLWRRQVAAGAGD